MNNKTFWLYKEAHTIDQQWSIKACGVRQRHIDQAQSFNLYITPQMKAKEILDLYVEAYKQGIKTIYYIRNQSLEMDECTKPAPPNIGNNNCYILQNLFTINREYRFREGYFHQHYKSDDDL